MDKFNSFAKSHKKTGVLLRGVHSLRACEQRRASPRASVGTALRPKAR